MRAALAISLLSAVVLGLASPTGLSNLKVKESVSSPRGWIQGTRAPADHSIELKIALPQPNFNVLEKHLYEVSDPSHSRYGQHLSKEAVEELVAPHATSIQLVNAWLSSHGFEEGDFSRSPAKDWITLRVPAVLAEKMLDTTFHVWTHEESGDAVIRTLSYSLPESLHEHIDLIQPTTMFARMKKQKTTFRWSEKQATSAAAPGSKIQLSNGISVDASCNETVTITCLKELYNAVGFEPSAKNGNQIGITGYLEQFANLEDLKLFFADQNPAAVNSSFKFVSINGGQNSQNVSEAGAEADLDTQFAFGLTFPTPATFFSTAGMPPFIPDIGTPTDSNEPYTTWLDFVLAQSVVPQTISTSYGDDEQTVPVNFAQRVCNGFAQLGARGTTLMFSSGDGGVGDGDPDPATQQCFTNDGRNATQFLAGFPASCPFVTAVGGTIHVPEVAVSFSGGGFSKTFSRPAYQNAAVEDFLQNKLPKGRYAGLFNPNGRAFPDVSAQADNFRIFFQGSPGLIGGTSASSPTFAGFVSLLNSARLSAGKPPLGFLNPLLYSTGELGFNDITIGNNPGCGTPGFNATEGWDPVTGLGTPNFAKLRGIVLSV
ncbi:tripeptidyl peptidase A [Schizopora paradoxa]|uniref:tripeptidyl-peptidase II n=1 Tax=Schizopora paradoxa TaxID=27342 RepID=A0A0H2SDZ6_9AGAM|nr:tripeptidyl peptidase A [Schizopora paradoxa]